MKEAIASFIGKIDLTKIIIALIPVYMTFNHLQTASTQNTLKLQQETENSKQKLWREESRRQQKAMLDTILMELRHHSEKQLTLHHH